MIYSTPLGMYQTNCHIITTDQNNAIAIDIGSSPDAVLEFLNEKGLTLKKIVLTHGHFDHIGGTAKVAEVIGATVMIHEFDEEMLDDPKKNFAQSHIDTVVANRLLKDGDIVELDNIKMKVMLVDGHTKGSILLIGDNFIMSGDTVFAGSVGRTDLYGGNHARLLKSIERIKRIEGDYTIYAGHGGLTTLDKEKATNPYFTGEY